MKYKILKNIECLLFCLYLGFFKSTYSSPDDIPSILDEFNIYHPIIINTMTDTKDLMRIVKSMSFNGQSINFNKNRINPLYQSYLIFTNLRNFKWHEPTSAPILVVSRIRNEIDLKLGNGRVPAYSHNRLALDHFFATRPDSHSTISIIAWYLTLKN